MLRKFILAIALVAIVCPMSTVVAQTIDWMQTYSYENNHQGHTVIKALDDGYIIAGYINAYPASSTPSFILKVDDQGNEIWKKLYNDIPNVGKYGKCNIIKTSDNCYLLTGAVNDTNNKRDIFVIKVDINGDSLWAKTYGGGDDDVVNSVVGLADGSFVMCGSSKSYGEANGDLYVLKLDSNGNIIWSKTFGTPVRDVAEDIISTSDLGFMLGGTSYESYNAPHPYIVKLNYFGQVVWSRILDKYNMGLKSLLMTPQGDMMVSGYKSFGSELPFNNPSLMKLKSDGTVLWKKDFDYFNGSFQEIQMTDEGNFMLNGSANEYYWLSGLIMKTDINGDVIWSDVFQVNDNQSTYCYSLDISSLSADTSIYACGYYWHYDSIPNLNKLFLTKITDLSYTGAVIYAEELPDTVHTIQGQVIYPINVSVYAGDFSGNHAASDVNMSSVVVNGHIAPVATEIVADYPEYTGEALEIIISLEDFVSGYGVLFDTTTQTYSMSGIFNDDTPFVIDKTFTMIGHTSGDVNFDGTVDISDLIYMVNYFFASGPMPEYMLSADMNHDTVINIADLTEMVNNMF